MNQLVIPVVSVWLITYNHEAYIVEAIESVLRQQTDFAVELVIGEDCSTDGTRAIVQEYQRRYPDRITLYLAEANMGMVPILRPTYALCRGKYIAMLDGDDYWTDPLKLQKQVDQLESQPDVRFSFHQVSRLIENTGEVTEAIEPAWADMGSGLRMEDLLRNGNLVVTLSVLFRNDLGPLPEWYYKLPYPDLALYFLLLMHGGTARYLSDNMGVYRIHQAGWFSGMSVQHRHGHGARFMEEIRAHMPARYQGLLVHELHYSYYESIVLALKKLQLGAAAHNWLRLGAHSTTTATHRPKTWPHSFLLAGLKRTGRILHRLGLG